MDYQIGQVADYKNKKWVVKSLCTILFHGAYPPLLSEHPYDALVLEDEEGNTKYVLEMDLMQ